MKEYKQAILIRTDLKMGKGKIASQASHASVQGVLQNSVEKINLWKSQGMKKIVLKVKDEKELMSYKRKAGEAGLIVAVIKDAGRTQVEPGTVTALVIGPDEESKIDKITGDLKIL